MQRESNITKILKWSAIAYSIFTVVFFALTNLAAGFIAQNRTEGFYYGVIITVNLMVYVELFGYFAILAMVFLYLWRKNKFVKLRQPMPEGEKFPTIAFIISLLFFFLFMSLMSSVL